MLPLSGVYAKYSSAPKQFAYNTQGLIGTCARFHQESHVSEGVTVLIPYVSAMSKRSVWLEFPALYFLKSVRFMTRRQSVKMYGKSLANFLSIVGPIEIIPGSCAFVSIQVTSNNKMCRAEAQRIIICWIASRGPAIFML